MGCHQYAAAVYLRSTGLYINWIGGTVRHSEAVGNYNFGVNNHGFIAFQCGILDMNRCVPHALTKTGRSCCKMDDWESKQREGQCSDDGEVSHRRPSYIFAHLYLIWMKQNVRITLSMASLTTGQ